MMEVVLVFFIVNFSLALVATQNYFLFLRLFPSLFLTVLYNTLSSAGSLSWYFAKIKKKKFSPNRRAEKGSEMAKNHRT